MGRRIPGQGGRRHDGSVGRDVLGFGGGSVIGGFYAQPGHGSARRSCFQFSVSRQDASSCDDALLYQQRCNTATLGGMADFIPQLSFAPISGA